MEITRNNFSQELENIQKNLKKSCFIGFDAEFTAIPSGENFKHRLFDTCEERYEKIRGDVDKMLMTQIGLTMFQYDRDHDTYIAVGYTFHLCPQVFGDVDQCFIFQASTLKFLCKHNFDFNKFTYEGIPYLSKAEEVIIKKHLKDNTLYNNIMSFLEMDEEKLMQQYCSDVSKWLANSDEDTMYIDVESPVLRFILHSEVRLRFPEVLTTDSLGNSKKVLIYRDKYVEGATSAPLAVLEDNLLGHLLGFSLIINLLQEARKPLIGHNIFLDILLLHNQFIGPLPAKYSTFKKNIHKVFPDLFDTKYISNEMGKTLSFDEKWKSNSLQDLYEFFVEGKCKRLQLEAVNPVRLLRPFDVKQSYHEAGWDSYCAGYCFTRLAQWAVSGLRGRGLAAGGRGGPPAAAASPTELRAALASTTNRVNVIRAAVPYMNIVGDDPPSHRPSLLHIKTLKERIINIGKVASVLSSFGSIDIKPYGSRAALIAANSNYTFDRILKQFHGSRDYRITKYNKYRHSVAGRFAVWSSAVITGSVVIYFIQKLKN